MKIKQFKIEFLRRVDFFTVDGGTAHIRYIKLYTYDAAEKHLWSLLILVSLIKISPNLFHRNNGKFCAAEKH